MRQAFTLIEALICVAILMIIGGAVWPLLVKVWNFIAHFIAGT